MFPDPHPLPGSPPPVMAPPAAQPPRRTGALRLALVAVFAGVAGGALALGAFLLVDDDPSPVSAAPPVTIVQPVRTEIVNGTDSAISVAPAVARAVIPSIVTVEVDSAGGADFFADSSGSGVVLDAAGNIVTNDHVVGGAEAVRVVFADGRAYEAVLVGTDPRTDLAVLKIVADDLVPIKLGSSRDLVIGDAAIAVGSPLGLDGGPSLTVGVISAFDRRVRTGPNLQTDQLFGMLQTDAPITSGSSGGALVDSAGRLIGITSAIGVSNVGAEGIGFAIPVELVRRVSGELIADGRARHAFLGIGGDTAFEVVADGALVPIGVEVASVESGSAASRAGLEVGDRILTLDDVSVLTMDGLIVSLRDYSVGTAVELMVDRNGETVSVSVVLGERED